MSPLPLLPVTTVGSWPRPPELLRAQRLKHTGRLSPEAFERQADAAVLEVLRLQDAAGVDIVTDGEQRRDNFYSFVAEKLAGVQLMTLLDMLEIVEDKASFERVLQTLDVPAYSMRNPTCVGRIERRQPLAVDELRFLKRHTDKPIKIPLPGPYILTALVLGRVCKLWLAGYTRRYETHRTHQHAMGAAPTAAATAKTSNGSTRFGASTPPQRHLVEAAHRCPVARCAGTLGGGEHGGQPLLALAQSGSLATSL